MGAGIINRYVLRQIAIPSVLAVSVVAIVGVANELQEWVEKLPLAQMTAGDVSRLALLFLPTLVAYLVPITYMLGILLAFARFSQNNELVAMKAAGIPMKRIIAPIIVVGALLSGASFLVQDRVQPWAVAKVYEIIYSELPLRATIDALSAGVMHEFGDWRVYLGRKDMDEGLLENIIIVKPDENSLASTYYAGEARLSKQDGRTFLDMKNVLLIPPGESGTTIRLWSDSIKLPVPQVQTTRPPIARREMSLRGLYEKQVQTTRQVEQTKSEPLKLELLKQRRDIADRLSMPFACLAVTFAAAPLGARAKRSGRSFTFAAGFLIMTVYYVLQMVMEPASLQALPVVVLRAWVPNLLFLLLGLGLVWRVDRV